jgi:hypothetical protein
MIFALSGQSILKTTPKSVGFVVAILCASHAWAHDNPAPFAPPVVVGQLVEPRNKEASGLAPSRRTDDLLWTHNDSGGEPVLFGLATDGSVRGAIHVEGVRNTDWEELASFELDGQAMLLIADTGNNFATRSICVLHVVPEPDPSQLAPGRFIVVKPSYSIHFVFEDGARDCEAVAVDPEERAIYLLSKRDVPARLYRLPLQAASEAAPAAARLVGTVPHLPQPVGLQRMVPSPLFGLRGQPTAMDFANDGRSALVLLYGGPVLFLRRENESWADALAREPIALPAFKLPQAEAACFSRDQRSFYVTSEQKPELLRYERLP